MTTVPPQVAAIFDKLRSAGGRITVARRALVLAIVDANSHVTAEDLAAHVQSRHPDVHLSTIYRTLDALEGLGIVTHVHLGHGRAVYHLAEDGHLHLVCQSCGAVIEIPASLLAPLADRVRAAFDFRLDPRHFALLGTCASCS